VFEDRRQAKKDENIRMILNTCEDLMYNQKIKFENISMNQLASESGFTKRTLYQYFINKEEILFHLMVRAYNHMIKFLEEYKLSNQNENELVLIGNGFYEYSQEYSNYFWVIMDYENQDRDFTEASDIVLECYRLGQVVMSFIQDAIKKSNDIYNTDQNLLNEITIFIWSSCVGIFNTMRLKKEYIVEYFKIEEKDFILNSLKRLARLI
jgi:AcrR family transcriptional regulator